MFQRKKCSEGQKREDLRENLGDNNTKQVRRKSEGDHPHKTELLETHTNIPIPQ